ncbi:hypothetical protein BX616_002487 [Lobosporangium transversale]|nr:hypothetical protein BX616_002487 [Lobosporangium transversale]
MKFSDPMTQVIILVGMFNSLSGTGSYGLDPKDSDVGNTANTALGAMFAVSSLFAGALFNIFGHRLLLIAGGLTYVLYVGSYLAYAHISSIAFVVVSSCLLGIGAGWLWTAQGAVMMGYPEEGEKGKYFSIFWAIFNCGAVLGNAIPLGISWNGKASGASDSAYIAYMVVMTFGAFLTLLLLPASKVIRKDGSHVVTIKYSSPISELMSVFALFKDWRMLALVPMFFTSNWFYTYHFSLNSLNFSLRTRSMNSLCYWLAQIIASILFGRLLDRASWTRRTRAKFGLLTLTLVLLATYIGAIAFQTKWGPKSAIQNEKGVWVKNPDDYLKIDLVDNSSAYIGPFFLYFFYGVTDAMYQGFSYWIMGALTNDTNQAARYAGFYKFVQNLGAIFAPLVQTSTIGVAPSEGSHALHASGRGMGELIVVIVLIFVGILGAAPVVFKAVKDHTAEENEVSSEKQEAGFEDVKA